MTRALLFLSVLAVTCFSEHIIPKEKYGPPYFYSADPAMRPYRLPFAAGETTFVSDGWRSDPGGVVGADHPDFAVDLDVNRAGVWCVAARAGRVVSIDEAPGGETNFCTVWIGRVDSIPDSTSTRSNGWRLGQTRDMYRHIVTGFSLKLGDFVEQGAPIARVIYAPLSSFTHLHFQVDFMISGTKVNIPEAFLEISGPGRSEGFPEVGDTYVSQNLPVGTETLPATLSGGREALSLTLYPNPFRSAISVSFHLKAPQANAGLEIYNASGCLVDKPWARSPANPGDYTVAWPAPRLAGGVYIFRLKADGKSVSKRAYR